MLGPSRLLRSGAALDGLGGADPCSGLLGCCVVSGAALDGLGGADPCSGLLGCCVASGAALDGLRKRHQAWASCELSTSSILKVFGI